MAVYITGDTHRDFERIRAFCERMETTREDIIIILGDAGINLYLDESDYRLKRELFKLPVTLFLIHGNHEERPYLSGNTYEEKTWHGGSVYVEEAFPNLIFAKDGEIYELNKKKAIVLGGAYSVDKESRQLNALPWFASEQPDQKIKNHVLKNLNKVNWEVDLVLSHTVPIDCEPVWAFIPGMNQEGLNC